MGNIHSEEYALAIEEYETLGSLTLFSRRELRALNFHFKTVSGGSPFISKEQFQAAMLFRDSLLVDRIFYCLDSDEDGQISFREYLMCLQAINSGNTSHRARLKEERAKFSFKLYDFDSDGFISQEDLIASLASILRENNLAISVDSIKQSAESTIALANPAIGGKISYDEYKKLLLSSPHMLDYLGMNITKIISELSQSHNLSFATPRKL